MIICTLDTRHFTFNAAGTSRRDALRVMKIGLRKHADECAIPRNWFEDYNDAFIFYRIQVGDVIRDGETVVRGSK